MRRQREAADRMERGTKLQARVAVQLTQAKDKVEKHAMERAQHTKELLDAR